jgi:hypothetical protein
MSSSGESASNPAMAVTSSVGNARLGRLRARVVAVLCGLARTKILAFYGARRELCGLEHRVTPKAPHDLVTIVQGRLFISVSSPLRWPSSRNIRFVTTRRGGPIRATQVEESCAIRRNGVVSACLRRLSRDPLDRACSRRFCPSHRPPRGAGVIAAATCSV